MKHLTNLTLFIAVLFFFTKCTGPQTETGTDQTAEEPTEQTNPAAEIAAIKAVHEQKTAGINGDLETYLSTLDDEVVIFPIQGPKIEGKDSVTKWYEEMAGMDFTLTGTPGEVVLAGDYAFENYTWTFSGMFPGEENGMNDFGKGVQVYKKQEDGSWKILWDIWNSDNPATEVPTMESAESKPEKTAGAAM